MRIEVHYVEPDGTTGVINRLTAENVGASTALDRDLAYERLKTQAIKMAGQWSAVFPETKFNVVDVDDIKKKSKPGK